jgi:hypothetical protein
VDHAVGEVEVVGRVRVEVGKERAEEPEHEGDRGQRDQRNQVGALERECGAESARRD